MQRPLDMKALLGSMADTQNFDDGSADRIWSKARNSRAKRTASVIWLAPAAAACTVLISLLAVPQARAAMADVIGRMFGVLDYMNAQPSERPGNAVLDSLILKDVPCEVTAVEAPGNGNGWIHDVKAHIDEVLYDGLYIYVKYTIDGRGIEGFRTSHGIGAYRTCMEKRFTLSDANGPIPEDSWQITTMPEKSAVDGVQTATVKLDQPGISRLAGTVKVDFTLSCNSENRPSGEELVGQHAAGTITLSFRFDAEPGNANAQAITVSGEKHKLRGSAPVSDSAQKSDGPREVSFNGCAISIVSVMRSPAELNVKVRLEGAKAILSPAGLLRLELLADGKLVGYNTNGYLDDSDGAFYDILAAPFLSEDVKRLTFRAVWEAEVDGKQVRMDIPGGTFNIDLQ